jgi:hypothetical protein
MAAETYDLTIDQGADWFWTLRWKVGSSERNSVNKDTSGYTARMQVRRLHRDDEIEMELTTENGGIVVGSDGSFQLHATSAQTAQLIPGKNVYDIEAIDSNGIVTKLVRGTVTAVAEVTR